MGCPCVDRELLILSAAHCCSSPKRGFGLGVFFRRIDSFVATTPRPYFLQWPPLSNHCYLYRS